MRDLCTCLLLVLVGASSFSQTLRAVPSRCLTVFSAREREREGESHTGCVIHVHFSLTYFKVNDECCKITKEIVKLDLQRVLSKELSCLGEL